MNSPKTSVSQTSAPVAALRAALPTETNARVESVLERLADMEALVFDFEKSVVGASDFSEYDKKIESFAVMDAKGREKLCKAARAKFPAYDVLGSRISNNIPPHAANRLRARLDAALEEAAEAATLAKFNVHKKEVSDLFPGNDFIYELTARQIAQLGKVRSLGLENNTLTDLPPETWKRLIPVLGKVSTLSLSGANLTWIPSSVWQPLASELGKVRSLGLARTGPHGIPLSDLSILVTALGKVRHLDLSRQDLSMLSYDAWRLLAPELGKVRSLNLSMGWLPWLHLDVWQLLAPELGKLRYLDLNNNSLFWLVPAAWKILAPALINVPSLDLRNNGLADLDPAVWAPLSGRKHDGNFQYGPESVLA